MFHFYVYIFCGILTNRQVIFVNCGPLTHFWAAKMLIKQLSDFTLLHRYFHEINLDKLLPHSQNVFNIWKPFQILAVLKHIYEIKWLNKYVYMNTTVNHSSDCIPWHDIPMVNTNLRQIQRQILVPLIRKLWDSSTLRTVLCHLLKCKLPALV